MEAPSEYIKIYMHAILQSEKKYDKQIAVN